MFTRNQQQNKARQSNAIANQEQVQKKDKEEQLEVDDLRPEMIAQRKLAGLSSDIPLPPDSNTVNRNGIYVSDNRPETPVQRQLQDNISNDYAHQELHQPVNGETPFQLKDARLELPEQRRMIADAGAHTISNAPMQFKSYLPLLNKIAKPPIQRANALSAIDLNEKHEVDEFEGKSEEEIEKLKAEKQKQEAEALKNANYNDVNTLASYFDIKIEIVEIVNGKYQLSKIIGDGISVEYALLVDENHRYHILKNIKSSGIRLENIFDGEEETSVDEADVAQKEDILYSTRSGETGMFEAIFYIQQFLKNASEKDTPLTDDISTDLSAKVAMIGGMMEEDAMFRANFLQQMNQRGKASEVADVDLQGTDDLFNQTKHLPPTKKDLQAMSAIASFYNNGLKIFGLERINNDYHLQWQQDLGRNVSNQLGLIIHHGNFYVTKNVEDGYLFKKNKDLAYQPFSGKTGSFEALLYVLSQTSKIPEWKYLGGLLETNQKQLDDFVNQIKSSLKSGASAKDYEKETALNQELGFTKKNRPAPHGANIKLLALLANNYKVSLDLFDLNFNIKQQQYIFGKPIELGKNGQESQLSIIVQNGNFYVVKGGKEGKIYKKEQLKYSTEDIASGVFEALFYIVDSMNLFNNTATNSENSNWKVVGQMLEKQPKLITEMTKLVYQNNAIGINSNNILKSGLTKDRSQKSTQNGSEAANLLAQYYQQKIPKFTIVFDQKLDAFVFKKTGDLGAGQPTSSALLEFLGNFYVVKNAKTGDLFNRKEAISYEPDATTRGLYESLFYIVDKEANQPVTSLIGTAAQMQLTNIMMLGTILEKDENIRDKIVNELKEKLKIEEEEHDDFLANIEF